MPRKGMLERLLSTHTVSVETFLETNGRGQDVYDSAVDVPGFLDDSRHVVLAKDGAEHVSEATFLAATAWASTFAPESRVTLPNGDVSKVITTNATDTGGLAARVEHVAVSLT